MSADNVIYVRKIKGKWVAWHDSASNDKPRPRKTDKRFNNEMMALREAIRLQEEIGYVEYGIDTQKYILKSGT